MAICEDVFRMHARKSVKWSVPPSQKLDVGAPFHNHWHVKTVILEDEPIAGVRLYSYYDDGQRNTVGRLDCARYIVLADPVTAHPVAILDEHWTYAIRSAAAAMLALKWLGTEGAEDARPRRRRHHGRELPALPHAHSIASRKSSAPRGGRRRAKPSRAKWSAKLGIPVRPLDSIEEVVRRSDIAIGGTTRTDIVSREPWVKQGATFVSLARREMDPAGWANFDKVVIDDWDCNMTRARVPRHDRRRRVRPRASARRYRRGRRRAEGAGANATDERILLHTTGMVSHDIGICWRIYQKARAQGLGIPLPTAVAQAEFGPRD